VVTTVTKRKPTPEEGQVLLKTREAKKKIATAAANVVAKKAKKLSAVERRNEYVQAPHKQATRAYKSGMSMLRLQLHEPTTAA